MMKTCVIAGLVASAAAFGGVTEEECEEQCNYMVDECMAMSVGCTNLVECLSTITWTEDGDDSEMWACFGNNPDGAEVWWDTVVYCEADCMGDLDDHTEDFPMLFYPDTTQMYPAQLGIYSFADQTCSSPTETRVCDAPDDDDGSWESFWIYGATGGVLTTECSADCDECETDWAMDVSATYGIFPNECRCDITDEGCVMITLA